MTFENDSRHVFSGNAKIIRPNVLFAIIFLWIVSNYCLCNSRFWGTKYALDLILCQVLTSKSCTTKKILCLALFLCQEDHKKGYKGTLDWGDYIFIVLKILCCFYIALVAMLYLALIVCMRCEILIADLKKIFQNTNSSK